jgi:CRISPR-associated protein Cst2
MKTSKKSEDKDGGSNIRSAAVRLSNAISLEEYKSDIEFLNNRINEFPNLANIEQHLSFYTYTITIDLEKIGVDEGIKLDNETRAKRVKELLEIVKVLNREIRGREENLSPIFVIGGLYKINSPFFLGRIKLNGKDGEFILDTEILKDTMTLKLGENTIKKDTKVGIVKNILKNEKEIEENFNTSNIQEFFEDLENQVDQYYKS